MPELEKHPASVDVVGTSTVFHVCVHVFFYCACFIYCSHRCILANNSFFFRILIGKIGNGIGGEIIRQV